MMRTITYENMKPQTDERAGLLIIDFRVIRDSYVCFYITMLPFITIAIGNMIQATAKDRTIVGFHI